MSLSLLVMLGGRIPLILEQQSLFASWWNAGGLLAVGLIASSALTGLFLPMRVLRVMWGTASVLALLLLFLTVPAFIGEGEVPVPWIWSMEPVTVSLPILLVPLPWALARAVLSGLSVATSSLVFFGYVPDAILALTPPHVSNVIFVVIFLGMRTHLRRLRQAEEQARLASEERVLSQATTASRERLAALIHDEVLSVLNAAMMFRGETPGVLRTEARTAIDILTRPVGPSDSTVPVPSAAEALAHAARRAWPAVQVSVEAIDDGDLPVHVVDEVTQAMAEAIRNSRRHSGTDSAHVSIDLAGGPPTITVQVTDSGRGFDHSRVDGTRLGLSRSISGRMHRIGGRSEVRSVPGQGAEVWMSWPA